MQAFLHRFIGFVLGVLSGFDRVVAKGKLPQLYAPEGMNCYLSANHVALLDFKAHAKTVTEQVWQASLVEKAKQDQRFRYVNSSRVNKDILARQIWAKQGKPAEPVVLQCVEPCWTFDLASVNKRLTVRGEPGKCSFLYHYQMHPRFGWMYIRLQTWFPFEVQIGLNGREWLARQMDQHGLLYRRSDNKFLWVQDWAGAQRLLDEQLRTNWVKEFDALLRQVHPLHPRHLGKLPLAYNWTMYQTEWATDVAFKDRSVLEQWYPRWLRHALLNYDSMQVLRFLGKTRPLSEQQSMQVHTDRQEFFEGVRLKHWVDKNSLKMYDHGNVLRVETTINDPKPFRSYRAKVGEPQGEKAWRVLRRNVADTHRRAEIAAAANERYLTALAGLGETKTVKELAEPLCRRVKEPGKKGQRQVRALNPLAEEDAALLQVVADPKWAVSGLRNRDLVAVLYERPTNDKLEQRRRSARVTRLLRLLRGHGLLQKVPRTHRYQVSAQARQIIVTLLAARDANAQQLMTKAA